MRVLIGINAVSSLIPRWTGPPNDAGRSSTALWPLAQGERQPLRSVGPARVLEATVSALVGLVEGLCHAETSREPHPQLGPSFPIGVARPAAVALLVVSSLVEPSAEMMLPCGVASSRAAPGPSGQRGPSSKHAWTATVLTGGVGRGHHSCSPAEHGVEQRPRQLLPRRVISHQSATQKSVDGRQCLRTADQAVRPTRCR